MRSFLIALLTPLVLVAAVNRAMNVGQLGEHDVVLELAKKQTPNELMYSSHTFDQRAWLKARLESTCPDVLTVGSSTMGSVREEALRGKTLINGWLGGGLTPEDYEALAEVLRARGCAPRVVLVGADIWSIADSEFADQRWTAWFSDYLQFRDGSLAYRVHLLSIAWSRFTELLTFTTTAESFRVLWGRLRSHQAEGGPAQLTDLSADAFCKTLDHDAVIRSFDGHYTTCPQWEKPPERIRSIAENYLANNSHGVASWKSVDVARLQRIAQALEAIAKRGSRVVFVALPYHPATFKVLTADPAVGENIRKLDALLNSLGPSVQYANLRDPAAVGCTDGEFEDSHHTRPSCSSKVIATLFDRGVL